MSTRIPTDIYGRSFIRSSAPTKTFPRIDYALMFLNTDGDKMEGKLDMNKNKILNLRAPSKSHEATNKEYLDA